MSTDFLNKDLQWFKIAIVVIVCWNVQGDEDDTAQPEGFCIGGVTNPRLILPHNFLKSGFLYGKASRGQVFRQLRLRIKCDYGESPRDGGRTVNDPEMRQTGETDDARVAHVNSAISSCNFDWIQMSFWMFVLGA